MNRIAVIVYHKNINSIYPSAWIEKFRDSILSQTFQQFDIFELNYGAGPERIFKNSEFTSWSYPTFAHAMNHLLNECFGKGYSAVFNTNCDDWYTEDRLEKQIPYIYKGWDIVSSNFALIGDDRIVLTHRFHDRDIKKELDINHNVICHPVVGYSKSFWREHMYFPDEIPFEDMKLWQRGIRTHNFIILEDVLCYHRLHNSSVGHKGGE